MGELYKLSWLPHVVLHEKGLNFLFPGGWRTEEVEKGADEAAVATQSLSTMCLSTTPSTFSEATEGATSFWL